MTANFILDWIIREGVDGNNLRGITIPSVGCNPWEQNEKWWRNMFGGNIRLPHFLEHGYYIFYYSTDKEKITDNNGFIISPSATLRFENDEDEIYFYKVQED